MKKLMVVLSFLILVFANNAFADGHGFSGLLGGAVGNLDGITTVTISDNDQAWGLDSTTLRWYEYDAASVAAESSPAVIIPDDNVSGTGAWLQIAIGTGDALTSNPLSQFAETTSAQLRGVLSDESGTGVFLTANGDGSSLTGIQLVLAEGAFVDGDKTNLDNQSGTNTGDNVQVISDATITTSDITTNNVTAAKHGFAPKLSNVATEYLNGQGGYSVPAGSGSGTVNTIKENDAQVGGSDIVTLDFLGADFDLVESPDTEIQIVINSSISRKADTETITGDKTWTGANSMGPLNFTAGSGSTTEGALRWITSPTGLADNVMGIGNGSAQEYFLQYITLPTADGQFFVYDETSDLFVPKVMSGGATMDELGVVTLVLGENASGTESNYSGTVVNPDAVYAITPSFTVEIDVPAAFTISALRLACDADPTTEITFTFAHKATGVGYGTPTTIEAVTTTSGVANITSGIDDATIPADRKIIITMSDPDDALLEVAWKIEGAFD